MKKLIAFIFAALFAAGAWAHQYEVTVNGVTWYYNVRNGEAEITYRGSYYNSDSNVYSGSLTIPSTLDGYKVTSIGSSAFYGCSSLTSITIPDSVTTIGSYAFQRCSSLTSVTIPDSVTKIGSSAFVGCSSLTSVTIPNSVTTIGSYALSNTPFYNNLPDGFVILGNGILYVYKGACPSSVTIPDGVTTIGHSAFYNCSSLTSVTIPDSVTEIGEYAFYGCISLMSVAIPNSVTTIGLHAFENCSSLTSVTIPDSVTTIASQAFYNCSSLREVHITDLAKWCTISFGDYYANPCYHAHHLYLNGEEINELVIPDSVTKIGSSAFRGCSSFTSVTIPEGVTEIGFDAFGDCSSLTLVTIPDSVKTIVDWAFYNCSSLMSVAIPDSVTSIGEGVFGDCSSLTSVTIPDSVTTIGDYAFSGCSSLTSVTIPNSVTTIDSYAFYDCNSLKKTIYVDYGDSERVKLLLCNTSIDINALTFVERLSDGGPYKETVDGVDYTFSISNGEATIGTGSYSAAISTSTTGDLTIPSKLGGRPVTTIGDGAFYFCSSLTSVTIPDSVTTIGDYAFAYCSSLASVMIGNGVSTIGSNAFCDCNLLKEVHITDLAKWCGIAFNNYTANPCYYAHHLYLNGEEIWDLVIPESVTTIEHRAFSGCSSLTSMTIPNSVKTIGPSAFESCISLTSVTIPDGVTTIGDYAFSGCSSIESIAIPESVTMIGNCAFEGCYSLNSVHIFDLAAWCNITFKHENLIGPSNPICYAHHLFLNDQEVYDLIIPDEVTAIGTLAFFGCSSLTSVTIPDSVTTIGEYAFEYCSSLTSVTIPDSVTTIGSSAFRGCSSLTSITIPDSVTTIGDGAFENCTSLASVTIPDSVTTIGHSAFRNCSSLTSVTISNSVTAIGSYAFAYCRSLTSVTIPDSVTSIGSFAFFNCSSLTSATMPNGVAIVNNNSFVGCSGLADLNGFIVVNGVLFDYCGESDEIEVPSNVIVIGPNAFARIRTIKRLVLRDNVQKIQNYVFSNIVIEEFKTDFPEVIKQAIGDAELANPFEVAKKVIVRGEDVTDKTVIVTFYPGTEGFIQTGDRYDSALVEVKYGHTAVPPEVSIGNPFVVFDSWSNSFACVFEDMETTAIYKKKNIYDFVYELRQDYWFGSSFEPFEIQNIILDSVSSSIVAQGKINSQIKEMVRYLESEGEENCGFTIRVVGLDDKWQRVQQIKGDFFEYEGDYYWTCKWNNNTQVATWMLELKNSHLEGSYELYCSDLLCEKSLVYRYLSGSGTCNTRYDEFEGCYVSEHESPLLEHARSGEVICVDLESGNALRRIVFLVPSAESGCERLPRSVKLDYYCVSGNKGDYNYAKDYYRINIAIDPDIFTYNVKFVTGDNWTYNKHDEVEYVLDEGELITICPRVSIKDGWHFVGWDYDMTKPVTEDLVIKPLCEPNTYTITYENYPEGLGYELPTSYTYNEDCSLPEIADYSFGSELPDGTKASTYRFEGWTINGEKVDKIPAGTIGDVVVKFNSSLLVNFGDTEGHQPMPSFSHDTTVAWKGESPTPKVTVAVEGRGELVEGQDFTVEYVDNDKVGTAKVIVRGKGDYIGTYTGCFLITKGAIIAEDTRKDIFAWSPSSAAFAYDGTEKSISTIIAEDVDEINVEVTGTTSAVNAGVYTAKAKGTIKRFASDDYYNYTYVTTVDSTKTLTIIARDLSDFSAALSQDVFFYDGAAKYLTVSITDEGLGVELKNGQDYNVSYLNNAQIGEASVTITGCGNYKGIITRQFTILDRLENLPKISITPESKVVNGRATITMTYSGIAGYETEVRYTTDGSEPTKDSSKYEKRFAYVVSTDTTIMAAAFLRGVRVSEVASERYLPSVNAAIVQTGEGCGPVEVQTSGAAPWVLDVEELGEDGTPSMKSGKIGNNGESIMTATFEGDGVFEFWWKTSCEYDDLEEFFCDHVECWLDGEVYTQADGETPWTKVVVSVTTKGSHTITWKYVKDDADDAEYPGEDCAWVDGVKFSFAAYVDFAADEEIVGTLPERIVSSAGYEIELPELGEVTYEKHVFAGWKYGDKIYQPGEKLTVDAQDMVVKPIWTEVLEVSYDLNGGNGNVPVTQQVVSGGSVNLAGIGEASLDKHSFGGWSLNGNVYAAGTGFVPQCDVQFTAVWIAKTLNMPIISVATEHDEPTTVVEITSSDDEVTIYYTTDGTDPSEENGTRYEGAFEVAGSVTIKAIAIKEDYFDSEVVEATVVSTYTPMSVGFVGGEGVVGTMPSAIETALRREIELPEIGEARLPKHSFAGWTDGTQIYQPGDKYSIVGEVSFAAVWTEKILSSPKIEVAEWYDTEKAEVVITCDDEDAVIYYTIDGTEPNSSSLKYEDGFEVEGSLTIKAIAIAEDWFDSEIVEKGTTRAPWTINEILNSALEFSTGGDSAWKRDLVDGDYVMRSGEIDNDEISWFKVKIPGAGKLVFEWKVSCESFFNKNKEYAADEAIFQAGDTEIEFFGDKSWAKVEPVDVTEGEAIWSYRKDESDSAGQDCVWIRNVVWTSAGDIPNRPEAIEGASEKTKAAFDQWILTYEVKNPSEANVNAFILGLTPTATDDEIQQVVEEELENLDLSKLAEGDLSAAVEAIQAKYPNAKVALEEVTTIETNAHLYKLVIDLK